MRGPAQPMTTSYKANLRTPREKRSLWDEGLRRLLEPGLTQDSPSSRPGPKKKKKEMKGKTEGERKSPVPRCNPIPNEPCIKRRIT